MVETLQPPRFGAGQQSVKPAHSSRRLAAAFDFATASHARTIVFLVLCGLVLFLPGFFNIPAIDRDEARFAQATKQMVETGDFVDIRFQDDVRYKKPVGIYWMQAAVVETASALGLPGAELRIWLYRIPSLIGAIGAVLLTYWAALAFVTRRGAVACRADDVQFGPARGRSTAGENRRDAAADRRRGDGGDGPGLPVLAARRGPRAPTLERAGDLLDRAGRRHPAQGAAHPAVRRA